MSHSVSSTSSSGSFGMTSDEYKKSCLNNPLDKFYSSWRNDDRALEAYFQACVLNWKMYEGKKAENDVVCIFALYAQVTEGDYTGDIPNEGLMMGIYKNTDPRNKVLDKLTKKDIEQQYLSLTFK